jgi:ABC-type transport system substrate-binding protein
VDSLLEKARVEPDQIARFQQYNRIEQLIVDDAPWIPLWHSTERKVLIKPQVKDYFLVPMTIPKLRHVYFSDN